MAQYIVDTVRNCVFSDLNDSRSTGLRQHRRPRWVSLQRLQKQITVGTVAFGRYWLCTVHAA